MDQNAVRRCRRRGKVLARQPEVDWAPGCVAEHQPGEHAIARDGMKIARDAMLDVVKEGGGRLADAACIIAVPAAAGEPRNNCRAPQALRVEELVVGGVPPSAPQNAAFPP